MSGNTQIPPRWLTEKAVAKMLACSISALQKHRFQHKGLPYSKFGRAVRYNETDVLKFMESKKITPSSSIGISPSA